MCYLYEDGKLLLGVLFSDAVSVWTVLRRMVG